jgi:hypothetical protein
MLHNFTVADVLGIGKAAALLALFFVPPGYVAGWLTDAFHFRARPFIMRFVLSTPVSVALLPIVVYFLGPYPRLLWQLFALIWLAFAVILASQLRNVVSLPRACETRIAAMLVLGWTLLAIVSLADLQMGDRLYSSTTTYDHCVRSAFTAAAARQVPPANPFFADVPPPLLRYHYFWMLLCSLPCRLAGAIPRHALYGGTVWAGIALMSLIVVGLERFTGFRERLGRRTLLACGLLAVTGLDILPNLYLSHFKAPMYADPEWWNVQISSWASALLWAPHHIMGMIACLTGFLVMRQPAMARYQRGIQILFAALSFAGAFGLSYLATFTFAVSLILWVLVSAWHRWWDEVVWVLVAGMLALAFAFPYLHSIVLPGVSGAGNNGVLRLAVREFPLGMRMLARHTGLQLSPILPNLLFLPLSYFLELGFFSLVAVMRLKDAATGKIRVSREEMAAWAMISASFLIGSFLRSTSLDSNDLGWRCFLQAQFLFLLWGACLLDRWRSPAMDPAPFRVPRVRRAAIAMLVLGALGTVYQVIDFRLYFYLYDRGLVTGPVSVLDPDRQVGRRTFALRSAYEEISASLPQNAVVQYNPLVTAYIPHLLYSGRNAAIGLPNCGANFGGDPARCRERTAVIVPLFSRPSADDFARLDNICGSFGIDVLVATDLDPAWAKPDSWIWSRPAFLANPFVRAFRCGRANAPAPRMQ